MEVPRRAATVGEASGSAKANSSGATARASSCSGPWPAAAAPPSARNTSGSPVRFTSQYAALIDT